VPGLLRMAEAAHLDQGRLLWARLFEPAIQLAEEGFILSPRLHAHLLEEEGLKRGPEARGLYFDAAGQPFPVGARMRNPQLAETFRRIAAGGAQAFWAAGGSRGRPLDEGGQRDLLRSAPHLAYTMMNSRRSDD
jgi:gamma-glutamyltranspeptidase / glutathione hydrolase